MRRMKTFLRRWWITNRLYCFTRKTGAVWVDDRHFIDWLLGRKIVDPPNYWHSEPPRYNWIHKQGLSRLLDFKTEDTQLTELRNLIDECLDKEVGYIKEERVSYGKRIGRQLMVGIRGLEIYPVSYLIFGHYYARTIWTGIIVGLVVWFIVDRVQNITPPSVQVTCGQCETQVSSISSTTKQNY